MEETQKENKQEIETPKEQPPIEETPKTETSSLETQGEEITSLSQQEVKESQPQPEIPVQAEPLRLRQLWQKFLESLKERKAKRLEKILQLAREKGTITNDDVEKLLRVSDSTATRYLNQLVREGRLKRLGSPSHAKYQIP